VEVSLSYAKDPNLSLDAFYNSELNIISISWNLDAGSLAVAKVVGVVVKDEDGNTIAEKKQGRDKIPKKMDVTPLTNGSHEVKFYYQNQDNKWFNAIRNVVVNIQKENAPELDYSGAVMPGGTIDLVKKENFLSKSMAQIVSVSWVSGAVIEKVEYSVDSASSRLPGLVQINIAKGVEESVTFKVLFDNSITRLVTIPVIQPVQPSNEGAVNIQCDLISSTGESKGNFQYSYDGNTVDYIASAKYIGNNAYYYTTYATIYSVTDEITTFSNNSDIMFGYIPLTPVTVSPQRSMVQFEKSPVGLRSLWVSSYGAGYINLEDHTYEDNDGNRGSFSCHSMDEVTYDLEDERQKLYSEIIESLLFDNQRTKLNQYARDAKNENDIEWSRNQLTDAVAYYNQVIDLRSIRLQELNSATMYLSDKTKIKNMINASETIESLQLISSDIQRASQIFSGEAQVQSQPDSQPSIPASTPEAPEQPDPRPAVPDSNTQIPAQPDSSPSVPGSNTEAQVSSNVLTIKKSGGGSFGWLTMWGLLMARKLKSSPIIN
jgi:hypothetical protein